MLSIGLKEIPKKKYKKARMIAINTKQQANLRSFPDLKGLCH